MAKYLLVGIAAKFSHSNPALRDLLSYRDTGTRFDIAVREFTINQSADHICGTLLRDAPEVLLLSCYIWNRSIMEDIIEHFAAALPDTAVFLGGPEASYQAEVFLRRHENVHGVLCGEGEVAFAALLQAWETDASLDQVPGLARLHASGMRQQPAAPPIDLAELPFPYDDPAEVANKIVYYESSRGCPYRCAYCLSSLDKCLRLRPLELVLKDLARFLADGIRQVKFIDRTFNADDGRAVAIWRFLQAHDNGISNFHFEITADILSEEALQVLETLRPGLVQFEIGVQSTHPPTLQAVHRHVSFSRLTEVVERLGKQRNIHLHLDLIAGLPYENLTAFQQSFNDVFSLAPSNLQLGFLKVLPGSEIADKAEAYGLRFVPRAPYEILSTPDLPLQDLLLLKDLEAVLSIYYNSGQFRKTMRYAVPLADTPFAFFCGLAVAWRDYHLFDQQTGLLTRCDALRDYVRTLPHYQDAIFATVIHYDLAAREKPRRLPDWVSQDSVADYATEQLFYEDAACRARYLPRHTDMRVKAVARQCYLVQFDPAALGESGPPCYYVFDYSMRDIDGNAIVQAVQLPVALLE